MTEFDPQWMICKLLWLFSAKDVYHIYGIFCWKLYVLKWVIVNSAYINGELVFDLLTVKFSTWAFEERLWYWLCISNWSMSELNMFLSRTICSYSFLFSLLFALACVLFLYSVLQGTVNWKDKESHTSCLQPCPILSVRVK